MANPLWARWKERLQKTTENWSRRSRFPEPPADFEKAVRQAKTENDYQELRRTYSLVYSDREHLLSARQQEDWADVREKLRFLIFRTALALVIMFVVLLTAYLAKQWELPLPFLRMTYQ